MTRTMIKPDPITGARVEVPYDHMVMGFEFKGDWIHHPLLSECGRFIVSPDHYGFTMGRAGWELHLEDHYFVVKPWAFFRYTTNGELVASVEIEKIPTNVDDEA